MGEACIGDFGLSEIINETDPAGHAETAGNSSDWKYGGNPMWQAPELFDDCRRTTYSDIFALGRVTYEVF